MGERAERVDNLDLVRGVAIAMVLVYHTVQMAIGTERELGFVAWRLVATGQYGVDLFFVLSGFLVGGLYWREHREHGAVERLRFIARRALRTMPPYFVALALAYTATRAARGDAFDWRFLTFTQNYEAKIPYFTVSWSLCIEEHFYLALPFLLGAVVARGRYAAPALLIAAVAVSLGGRALLEAPTAAEAPGFTVAATHLRLDGLALGVFAAYLAVHHTVALARLVRWRWPIVALALAAVLALQLGWLSATTQYVAGFTVLAVAFTLVVVLARVSSSWRIAEWRWTKRLALASYSIYLTHALVIHAIVELRDHVPMPNAIAWLVMLAASIGVGLVFYHAVEQPAIRVRDALLPRRASAIAPEAAIITSA